MLTYTIPLGDRSADKPEFSDAEAGDMARLGFRFSEFRPETGRYRLSPGYRTLHNLDRGTLTFQQADEPRRAVSPAGPAADTASFEPAPVPATR
jgi:hypothetical protein